MNMPLIAPFAAAFLAAAAQQPVPAPSAPPVADAAPTVDLVAAPEGRSAAVALAPITESALLSSPVPTVSPAWGYRATLVGGAVAVTGGERAVAPGAAGQLALFRRVGTEWTCDPNLAQVDRIPSGAFFLSRIVRAGDRILTAVDRRDVGSSVRVMEPRDGRLEETASLTLPPEHDLPSFASAYAGTAETAFVGSADLRFNLGDASDKRVRDPRVFVYARSGKVWAVQGFVRCPNPSPGTPTDAMWFGASLAADGDVLVAGQPATIPPRPSEALPYSGRAAVHVFRRTGDQWVPEARLDGAAVTPSPCFGVDVAVQGDLLAVRSADLSSANAPGNVWLFERRNGTWAFAQELLPAAGIAKGRGYGLGLAVSGGRVLVGDGTARGADETVAAGPGMVLVFERKDGAWANTMRLMPKAPCGSRSFGNDVTAEWPLVAVGRPRKEPLGLEPGGAYLFDLSGK